ncbi:MAG: CvpA family protein [Clostridia bacterium]|nr:CvpA family protein [Clostridia bacterium]
MEAGTIILIINVVFFAILLIGFLSGLRRGLKRSTLHLAFVALAILIAYFATRPIVDMVLGLEVIHNGNGVVSIQETIVGLMGDDVAKYSPTLAKFITQLPSALISPIVFMVVLIVVQSVIWIIYMIVARIWFKTRRYEKKNGIKRHRLLGALIGTIEALVFAVFLFMPLTSLTNTFGELAYVKSESETSSHSQVAEESKLYTTGEFIRETMPQYALDILDGYNSSFMGSVCHLGGFDHVIYNGLSYVDINGEKVMWRDEVTLFANIYNKSVEILNKEGDLSAEDYEKLSEMANQFLEGKFLTHVISPTITEVISNFDKVLEDSGIEEEIRNNVQTVVDNLNKRFDAGVTFIEYVQDNVKVLVDVVNELSENGALDALTSADEFVDALTYDTLSKVVPQVGKIAGMTLIEDIYHLVGDSLVEGLKGLDEYIDVESFKDYKVFKTDITKLCEVVRDVANVKESETSKTNMLQDIVNGKDIDVKVFVNSNMATTIIREMTGIKTFEKGIVVIMETVDDEIVKAISSMSSKEVEQSQFYRTITSTTSTPEEKAAFVEKLSLQAEDFVNIARIAVNGDVGKNLSDIGAVIDVMKDNVTKNNFNQTTFASDGVFNAMFKNMYKALNGTIKDVENKPIFADYEKFNDLIEERANGETTDLKYYKVDYKQLFTDLQNAKDVADAYETRKDKINTILSSEITSESVGALKTQFVEIINEVGADEFVSAVNVAMDILGDKGYNLTNGLGADAKQTVTNAIATLDLGEDISDETLQEIKDSLNKLFQVTGN